MSVTHTICQSAVMEDKQEQKKNLHDTKAKATTQMQIPQCNTTATNNTEIDFFSPIHTST